jgi:hypothetical protein
MFPPGQPCGNRRTVSHLQLFAFETILLSATTERSVSDAPDLSGSECFPIRERSLTVVVVPDKQDG